MVEGKEKDNDSGEEEFKGEKPCLETKKEKNAELQVKEDGSIKQVIDCLIRQSHWLEKMQDILLNAVESGYYWQGDLVLIGGPFIDGMVIH